MASYIFITGGVISALGKGIVVASIGRMLKSRGVAVVPLKLDPYLNVDPGTMSPYQHGEVFVTVDGRETDLDLGHYERFIDLELSSDSNVTAGQIYRDLIKRERQGDFLGRTIQTVPHVTSAIRRHIKKAGDAAGARVVVVEVGGTVGDIECQPFLEAIRQMRGDETVEDCFYIHLTLMPSLSGGELKTKPTQHSLQVLRSAGIQPDMVMCRADQDVPDEAKEKIAALCNVARDRVVGVPTLDNVYHLPQYFEEQGVGAVIANRFQLEKSVRDTAWYRAVEHDEAREAVKIAIIGKYVELPDAYISVKEALSHAAHAHGRRVDIDWVSASQSRDALRARLAAADGVLVPGGFGARGIDGMVSAAEFARTRGIPYLGLCLGLHVMIIEFARNVLGFADANSVEFDPDTEHPVIDLMPDQSAVTQKGGTMRLGVWQCNTKEDTLARRIYDSAQIFERHRHRYEVNNLFLGMLEKRGLQASGYTADGKLVEICELGDHPFMIGCQFHPEFASRPNKPHPLFNEFIKNALGGAQSNGA